MSALAEFESVWLPHTTDAGLSRILGLLTSASPLLIQGAFSRAIPLGCLASHIAWNHPATTQLSEDAGVCWLAKVAGLNPATSPMVLAWDYQGMYDFAFRSALIAACRVEQSRRLSRRSGLMAREPIPC